MKASIKTKIMLFSATLLFVVIFCQIFFGVFLSKNLFIKLQQKKIEDLFDILKTNYSDDPDVISSLAQETQEIYNISIEIFDYDKIIFSNGAIRNNARYKPLEYLRRKEPRNIFRYDAKAVVITAKNSSNGLIRLNGLIDYASSVRYVSITSPIGAIEASIILFTESNFIIAVFALIIGIISSLLFAMHISRPIKKVEAVAHNISSMSFDQFADETVSTSELCNLSVSINQMAVKMNSMIQELLLTNEALKKDVDYQKQIEIMHREFIANVSHEMKTPLCLLLIYCENLKNNITGIDKDYYCEIIMEEAQQLNEMVRTLLDISSIENNLTNIQLIPVNFTKLCKQVLQKTDVILNEFIVTQEYQEDLCILGAPKYLEQAICNFLTNAFSHTHSYGKIRVSLYKQDNNVLFSVHNEGKLIEESKLPRIWDSFYRADPTPQDDMHMGLGLYIVRTIINAHGGKYGVFNETDGPTFYFSLPVYEEIYS